jgi:Mlc titration factor MtfA (ptsG expression regulator)
MRRRRVLARPFPPAWREHLRAGMAHYARLSSEQRSLLEQLVQLLVAEKHWEGLGGLELTDEVRVTIAGQAGLLLLGFTRDAVHANLYRNVLSILVYPTTVMPRRAQASVFAAPHVVRPIVPVLGEAHAQGPVVLTWDAVRRGGIHPELGHNVVYHEFAHKLDMLDGYSDGTPPLATRAANARWTAVCTREYEALRAAFERGEPTFLDPYAATSASEFFAVATELFFDRPRQLRAAHPELYEVLRDFYRQDPALVDAP